VTQCNASATTVKQGHFKDHVLNQIVTTLYSIEVKPVKFSLIGTV